jgi:hypothetical protein
MWTTRDEGIVEAPGVSVPEKFEDWGTLFTICLPEAATAAQSRAA